MRYVIYILCFVEALAIIYLTDKMNERTFSPANMARAYEVGCNLGQRYVEHETFTCTRSSKQYQTFLEGKQ